MNRPSIPVCAVGAVVLREGKILLVKRDREPARGRWSLPGGHVMIGESLAEAIAREVKEETAIDIDVDSYCGIVERILRDDDGAIEHHFVIVDFYATARAAAEPVPGDDAADARWVPVEELPELHLTEGLLEFLADREVLATAKARARR